MTFSIKGLYVTLSMTMLCRYADCHYADCRISFIAMLTIILLSVIMLNIVAPNIWIGMPFRKSESILNWRYPFNYPLLKNDRKKYWNSLSEWRAVRCCICRYWTWLWKVLRDERSSLPVPTFGDAGKSFKTSTPGPTAKNANPTSALSVERSFKVFKIWTGIRFQMSSNVFFSSSHIAQKTLGSRPPGKVNTQN